MMFWKPKCKHAFSMWEIIKRGSNNSGDYLIVQERRCQLCGLAEVASTRSGA